MYSDFCCCLFNFHGNVRNKKTEPCLPEFTKAPFCLFYYFAYEGFSFPYASSQMWTTLFYLTLTNCELSVLRRMCEFLVRMGLRTILLQKLLVTSLNRFLPHLLSSTDFLSFCFPGHWFFTFMFLLSLTCFKWILICLFYFLEIGNQIINLKSSPFSNVRIQCYKFPSQHYFRSVPHIWCFIFIFLQFYI